MKIRKIILKNFRNYEDLNITFGDDLNIIIGNNAQGKTNLLESIYVLAVTKSFLTTYDHNLIKFDNKFSLLNGIVDYNDKSIDLGIVISDNGKIVKINHKEIKRLSDYVSKMNVVIFSSESVNMLKGSPASRRKYFNIQISQIMKKYLIVLNQYNNLLKQRNEFLKKIDLDKSSDLNYLDVLNEKYVEMSLEIYNYRNIYVDKINMIIGNIFKKITGLNNLKIEYITNFYNNDVENHKVSFKEKLNNNLTRDIFNKMTLLGPNRDDFIFMLNGKNLSNFGSQGQLRSAIISLKLSEVILFKEITGESPVLLLDDIFSELDIEKRNNILKFLNNKVQTILTTTDINNISDNIKKDANIYVIENGKIISREII